MASQFDFATMQSILQNLPEVQRRQRRASRLRNQQEGFMEMMNRPGQGNYQPQQQGGWFPTVQAYQKDYEKFGNQLVGGLGSIYSQMQGDKAEDNLNELRNQEIMGAIEGIGQHRAGNAPEGGATEATLRAYLQMMEGPDAATTLGDNIRVQSTQKLKNGNLGLVMSNGEVRDTGTPFDPKTHVTNIPGQEFGVTSIVGGQGQFSPVQFGGSGQQGGSLATPDFNPNAQHPQTPGLPDMQSLFDAIEAVESGGDQSAVSPKGARGVMQLMPNTARELEQSLGLPPGSTDVDPELNRMAGQQYITERLQARGGDLSLALADYNWGMGNVDRWLAAGGDPTKVPQETQNYVRRVMERAQGQQPQQPQQQGRTIRIPTEAEVAGDSERARIAARLGMASQVAQAEASERAAVTQAEGTTKSGVRYLDDINARADSAATEQARMDQLEYALSQTYSGFGAEQLIPLRQLGAMFGIGDANELGAAELARSISNQLALGLRNPSGGEGMPGALSNSDRDFLRQSVPSLQNSPDGWREVISMRRRLSEYALRQADEAHRYMGSGGSAEGLRRHMMQWANANPLFAAPAPTGAGKRTPWQSEPTPRERPPLPPGFSWED